MAASWNMTVTNKGIALQTKQVTGSTLAFTRVVTGTAVTPLVRLKELTEISNIKQTVPVTSITVEDNTFVIRALLSNNDLFLSYNLSQIGFYATDPDDGEILYAVAQIDEPRAIPSTSAAPGFNIEFSFTFEKSQSTDVTIDIDPSGLLTVAEGERIIDNKLDLMLEAGPTITE